MNKRKLAALVSLLACGILIGVGLAELVFNVNLTVTVGENLKAEITFNNVPVTGGTVDLAVNGLAGADNSYNVSVSNVGNVAFYVNTTSDFASGTPWPVSMQWTGGVNTALVGETITGTYHFIIPSNYMGTETISIHFTVTKVA